MISIITPTIRRSGLDVVRRGILKQSYKDIEWLIGSSFDPEIEEAIWVKDNFINGFWSLNRITNKLIKEAKGEIIVTLEDWIYINPDAIEKFVISLEKLGTGNVVTGVGDQYEKEGKYGKPEIKIWSDPRKRDDFGSFYEVFPNDIEFNFASFWKSDFEKIGECDEELDFLGSGVALYQCSDRWNEMGFKFWIDQTNESFTIRHGREDYGGQEDWDRNHVVLNGLYKKRKQELIRKGKWPILVR